MLLVTTPRFEPRSSSKEEEEEEDEEGCLHASGPRTPEIMPLRRCNRQAKQHSVPMANSAAITASLSVLPALPLPFLPLLFCFPLSVRPMLSRACHSLRSPAVRHVISFQRGSGLKQFRFAYDPYVIPPVAASPNCVRVSLL